MILSADWHLTDDPHDAYRWKVFDRVLSLSQERGDKQFYLLGDLTDRKDKHSAVLVNRVIAGMRALLEHDLKVNIIMGNHDQPLNGTPFWQFLRYLSTAKRQIAFYTAPQILYDGQLALLPYSANPASDWKNIEGLSSCKSWFMHQTVTGVKTDAGRMLENKHMPIIPRGVQVYSGDIHTPQVVGRVTYVGAPHPVKFGDTYPCRMLVLDDHYRIAHEEILDTERKLMLDLGSVEELEKIQAHRGDQVRVRIKVPLEKIEEWPADQERIAAWALNRGVYVASVEATIAPSAVRTEYDAEPAAFMEDPVEALASMVETEGVSSAIHDVGLALLRAELGGG